MEKPGLLLPGEISLPLASSVFRAWAAPGLKETHKQQARPGQQGAGGGNKKRLGTIERDLNFQLHFPAVMSSYFQGIWIM